MNFRRVIKSHGIGEIFVDEWDDDCYPADNFLFDRKKEIPFFKLLLNSNSLYCKYRHYLDELPIYDRILLRDLYLRNIELLKSFENLEDLCEDLFANGHIKTMIKAIINFYKFMDNEPFDFFDYGETRDIMYLIFTELQKFKKRLSDVIQLMPLIMGQSFNKTQIIIKEDFIYQLLYR